MAYKGQSQNKPRILTSGLIPHNDASILTDLTRLKDQVAALQPQARQKLVAFLAGIYHTQKLSDLLGVNRRYVEYCCNQHKDIVESAHLGRNFSIMDLAERKTIELIANINASEIAVDKRPQAAKFMMEVAGMAGLQTKPPEKDDDMDTMQLILKVKSKMRPASQPQVEQNAPIDITPEVEIKK